jgi:hypothetical protein
LELHIQSPRGKLKEAARYWAGERPQEHASIDAGVIVQLEEAGAPAQIIAEARRRMNPPEDDFDVWPDSLVAVELFCALGTQWRILSGMGGVQWQGIDYQSIEGVLRLKAISPDDWPALFNDLRIMERAALEVLNKH